MKTIIAFFTASLLPLIVSAQGFDFINKISKIPGCITKVNNSCAVYSGNQIIDGINLLIGWGAGIAGAVALLMFIFGGVYWLTSAGSQSRIQRGKDIMVGTITALFFILGSWLLVNFIVTKVLPVRSDLQLTAACATDGDSCNGGQGTCRDGICLDYCTSLNYTSQPELGAPNSWSCQSIYNCVSKKDPNETIGQTRTTCGNSPNCQLNLCQDQPDDIVCCYQITKLLPL